MNHKIIREIMYKLPKKMAHKILYYKTLGKRLNLKEPKNLNEKIQWLIINKYGEREGILTDKYLVKDYILKKKINNLYIPKTLKVYEKESEIDLNKLPDQFVLKCNNGSGKVFICTSKKDFDLERAKKSLKTSLNENFSKNYLEYHYSYIKPVIIAEEYLNDNLNINPTDYKFYCYNGHVESVLVCTEREKKLKLDDYDLNWNKLNYTLPKYRSNKELKKPDKLNEMIEIASKLSEGEKFVRVDLYEINKKIYFGELTFTPMAGLITYYNEEALNHLGSLINLSK